MIKLYYIKNIKTNKNYDTDWNHFFDENFDIDYTENKRELESLIKKNPERFKDCVIKEIKNKTK